jgi:hypothetical protein
MNLDTSKVKTIRLVIYQPNSASEHCAKEWTCTVDELYAFAEEAKAAVEKCEAAKKEYWASCDTGAADKWVGDYLHPGEKQCQWCKAKSGCPAIAKECLQGLPDLTKGDDTANAICVTNDEAFANGVENAIRQVPELSLDTLAKLHSVSKLFKQWQDAIDDRLFSELSAGTDVPGFKLVLGRGGHRKWIDEDEVEQSMKSMRLKIDEMYEKQVISPTKAEKLLKSRPKLMKKLAPMISRSEGKPQIALTSDKRPAIDVQSKMLEGLEDLTEAEPDFYVSTGGTALDELEFDLDDFEI